MEYTMGKWSAGLTEWTEGYTAYFSDSENVTTLHHKFSLPFVSGYVMQSKVGISCASNLTPFLSVTGGTVICTIPLSLSDFHTISPLLDRPAEASTSFILSDFCFSRLAILLVIFDSSSVRSIFTFPASILTLLPVPIAKNGIDNISANRVFLCMGVSLCMIQHAVSVTVEPIKSVQSSAIDGVIILSNYPKNRKGTTNLVFGKIAITGRYQRRRGK